MSCDADLSTGGVAHATHTPTVVNSGLARGVSEVNDEGAMDWQALARRLVASSMNTSSVHAVARSSNHAWSLPSIWTSSPTQARRLRGWCTLAARCLRGIHRSAAVIRLRIVSSPKPNHVAP